MAEVYKYWENPTLVAQNKAATDARVAATTTTTPKLTTQQTQAALASGVAQKAPQSTATTTAPKTTTGTTPTPTPTPTYTAPSNPVTNTYASGVAAMGDAGYAAYVNAIMKGATPAQATAAAAAASGTSVPAGNTATSQPQTQSAPATGVATGTAGQTSGYAINKVANVNTVIPGTNYTPAQYAAAFPGKLTADQVLNAYNNGGYQGIINISDTGTIANPNLAASNAAISAVNAARNAVINSSSAPITWTDANGATWQAVNGSLSYIGGGLTPSTSQVLAGSTTNTGQSSGQSSGQQQAASPNIQQSIPQTGQTSNQTASSVYDSLLGGGGGYSTTMPNLVVGAYPIDYQYGGGNSSDPVGSSNQLEQALDDVVNFNDNATDLLYNSPEYQAQRKALEIELLRTYQNTLGTRSGSTGIANTATASALGQLYNQAYANLYDVIPQDLANLFGRATTGYDAIRQYEQDAYNIGADTRNYDTSLFQWQYGQNKDNFLQDRDFQYLLNRDWIADQRYADETAWNRAMEERQQTFYEWANTYRHADGTPMSAAEFAQAQQEFDNAQTLATNARLDYLAEGQYNAYMNSGSSGGGGESPGLADLDDNYNDLLGGAPLAVDSWEVVDDGRSMRVYFNDGTAGTIALRSNSPYTQIMDIMNNGGSVTPATANSIINSSSVSSADKTLLRKYLNARFGLGV